MSVRVETDKETGVAVVTLDRPERHNAIDLATVDELTAAWRGFRFDDSVRAVVITGAGERAFCTGIDRAAEVPQPQSPYSIDDPLVAVGPEDQRSVEAGRRRRQRDGVRRGVLSPRRGEFVVADESATFFDPHTSYGMVSAYETIHLAQRMPFGEVARMALMGTAERISARRAYETGLVSELTAPGGALAASVRCAETIASYPTEAVQGTVRAVWAAKEAARTQALAHAPQLIALGNLPPERQAELFSARRPGGFRVR